MAEKGLRRFQMLRPFRTALLAALITAVLAGPAPAGEATVGVAANFAAPAKRIAAAFAAETGHRAKLAFGSTGKLYAQIAYGAPYHVFLAADSARPEKAEREGLAVPGSRFTYAVGRLVLYSRDPAQVDSEGRILARGRFARLAVGNPKTAPYGAAAVAALKALGLYENLKPKLVFGESIGQTHQFVATGNAPLGFVARAQVVGHADGSRWPVPESLHPPIRQDAVLLNRGAENAAARAFLEFLRGDTALAILAEYGYGKE